jgi:hypothetical protein
LPATPTGNFLSCGRRGYDTLCDSGDVNRGNCVVLAFSTPTSMLQFRWRPAVWLNHLFVTAASNPSVPSLLPPHGSGHGHQGPSLRKLSRRADRPWTGIGVGHAPHNAVSCSDGAPHCRCRPTRGSQLCMRSDHGGQGELKGCTPPRSGDEPQTAAMRLNDRATLNW